jgi:hypothetical protein
MTANGAQRQATSTSKKSLTSARLVLRLKLKLRTE